MGVYCQQVLLGSAKAFKKKVATQQAAKQVLQQHSTEELFQWLETQGIQAKELSL